KRAKFGSGRIEQMSVGNNICRTPQYGAIAGTVLLLRANVLLLGSHVENGRTAAARRHDRLVAIRRARDHSSLASATKLPMNQQAAHPMANDDKPIADPLIPTFFLIRVDRWPTGTYRHCEGL